MAAEIESTLAKEDLLALLDTAGRLTSMDTLSEALTNILKLAGELSRSAAGSVILHDPERNDLYFAAATGPASDTLSGIRIPVGKGKAGEVFSTGKPLVENKVGDHYTEVDEQTEFTTKSMICVPLRQADRTIGVMQILNKAGGKEAYDDRDLELLVRFGAQATIAIRNATLFEQMLSSSGLHAQSSVRQDLIQNMTRSGKSAIRGRFTVMFADMRGFSQICSMIPSPEKIQVVLSDYVLMLSSVVLRNGGIVNKVMGDGMLGVFRGDDSADSAVRAALDAIDGFERLKTSWQNSNLSKFNLDFLDLGVGIITDDEIILGTIGDDSFRDFTVIGAGVNLAAALVKQARDGRRLIADKATFSSLSDPQLVRVQEKFQLHVEKEGPLKGISYDVVVLARPRDTEPPKEADSDEQFDIFFSYRREGGADVARSVQLALRDKYKIFLDVDTMPSGHFDETLLRTIEGSPNFVVFLSPGSLDRCREPGDWLRKEIAHALATRRNIVPVMLPGFSFPDADALPAEVRDIRRHDAIEYSHRYFYAMLDKLREHIHSAAS